MSGESMSETVGKACPTKHWAAIGALVASSALIVGGCLAPALLSTVGGAPAWDAALVGLLYGTMYGQMSLAAAWFPLGPLSFRWRAILTAGLLAGIIVAVGISISGAMEGVAVVILLVGGMLFVQWVLTQLPFWSLVAFYHVQVCRPPNAVEVNHPMREFGIRQVMILTAGCAAVLGMFWLLFPMRSWQISQVGLDGLLVVGFVAAVDSLIMFPLTISVLLERKASLATAMAIGFAALVAASEMPVMGSLPYALSETGMLWWINVVRCAWVLGILLILRAGGYRLVRISGWSATAT
jgi:hypothetical protein